ncbi:MAG: hypothetical protein NVSMB47_00850 [Polyangiales bacterium]
MMRTSFLRALAVGVVVGCSLGTIANAAPKDSSGNDASKQPAAKPAIGAYDQAILDAHKAFAAGIAGNQIDDAISAYRKAIALDPSRPEGHLYLAGALYQKGDWAGAEEAANNAANRAKADKAYANLAGKALFLVATTKESAGHQEEARAAWQAYSDFAKANPDQEYPKGSGDAPPMLVKVWPASAMDRETKIDSYAKSKQDYAKVRELIEKRQKELGIPATPAPAPK